MEYIWKYKTPEGFDDLVMCGDGETLTGLWFTGSRDAARRGEAAESRETPVFRETCRWLDEYFAGRDPGFTPNYRIEDVTEFRKDVINELLRIPYGATVSYGDIAKAISKKHGGAKVSARAVGGAVGWNPIGIIIPCHRVIGADNGLTGYGGGLGNKISLLAHEGSDLFDVRLSAPRGRKEEIDGKFVRRCIQAVNRAAARHGLGRARCEEKDGGTTICLDALADGWGEFAAPFIFDECSDDDAKLLLESFVDYRALYQCDLAFQLSRLLARRGALVRARMGRVLAKTDWRSYGSNGLLLAYLASRKGSDPLICRLLDTVCEDNRDGLFLAGWHSSGKKVQKCLKRKFEEWIASDASWGSGAGEAWWLGAFLSKWTAEGTFPYEQLQSLTQWHLERQLPTL